MGLALGGAATEDFTGILGKAGQEQGRETAETFGQTDLQWESLSSDERLRMEQYLKGNIG